MILVVVQIVVSLLVLVVAVYHLYLDQFSHPKSDIQVYSNPNQLDYGPLKDDSFKLFIELNADNRGGDNGYIDSAEIIRFEFSNTDEFSDPTKVETSNLISDYDSDTPFPFRVHLKNDEDQAQILVPQGEVIQFTGESEIHTDRLKLEEIYSEYYSMRAIIEFHCRDNSRQYERRIATGRIDIW